MYRLISAESVTEGHPDKLADRISDSVLDAMLKVDPDARVAAETILTKGLALIAGEVTCDGYVDVQRIVRDTVREVGYTDAAKQLVEHGADPAATDADGVTPLDAANGKLRGRGRGAGATYPATVAALEELLAVAH